MFGNQLKKKYTMGQLYLSFVNGFVALPAVVKNHRKRTVDPHLIERLMLATTEVNGCEVCSYAHTRMALVEGFGQDEIEAFLSGSKAYVKAEEATAILYAQHVADTMGQPDLKAWERLVATYGEQHAAIMRAGITVMMMLRKRAYRSVRTVNGGFVISSEKVNWQISGSCTVTGLPEMVLPSIPNKPRLCGRYLLIT